MLTRIGLSILYNKSEAIDFNRLFIANITEVIQIEVQDDSNSHESNIDQHKSNITNKRSIANHKTPESLLNLRGYSLDASSRILAVANECRNVDTIIQRISDTSKNSNITKEQLVDLIGPIKLIEDSLEICQDDYRRLVLAYHKFMYFNYGMATITENESGLTEAFVSDIDLINQENFKEADPVNDPEFYALLERTDEEEVPNKSGIAVVESIDDELKRIDTKVIRRQFKPVLKQLKDKIDPINQSMRDREKRFFEMQGISFDEEKASLNDANNSDSDEFDSISLVRQNQNRENKFDDNRQFLQNKQQINFFSFPPPKNVFLQEDVVEDVLE